MTVVQLEPINENAYMFMFIIQFLQPKKGLRAILIFEKNKRIPGLGEF